MKLLTDGAAAAHVFRAQRLTRASELLHLTGRLRPLPTKLLPTLFTSSIMRMRSTDSQRLANKEGQSEIKEHLLLREAGQPWWQEPRMARNNTQEDHMSAQDDPSLADHLHGPDATASVNSQNADDSSQSSKETEYYLKSPYDEGAVGVAVFRTLRCVGWSDFVGHLSYDRIKMPIVFTHEHPWEHIPIKPAWAFLLCMASRLSLDMTRLLQDNGGDKYKTQEDEHSYKKMFGAVSALSARHEKTTELGRQRRTLTSYIRNDLNLFEDETNMLSVEQQKARLQALYPSPATGFAGLGHIIPELFKWNFLPDAECVLLCGTNLEGTQSLHLESNSNSTTGAALLEANPWSRIGQLRLRRRSIDYGPVGYRPGNFSTPIILYSPSQTFASTSCVFVSDLLNLLIYTCVSYDIDSKVLRPPLKVPSVRMRPTPPSPSVARMSPEVANPAFDISAESDVHSITAATLTRSVSYRGKNFAPLHRMPPCKPEPDLESARPGGLRASVKALLATNTRVPSVFEQLKSPKAHHAHEMRCPRAGRSYGEPMMETMRIRRIKQARLVNQAARMSWQRPKRKSVLNSRVEQDRKEEDSWLDFFVDSVAQVRKFEPEHGPGGETEESLSFEGLILASDPEMKRTQNVPASDPESDEMTISNETISNVSSQSSRSIADFKQYISGYSTPSSTPGSPRARPDSSSLRRQSNSSRGTASPFMPVSPRVTLKSLRNAPSEHRFPELENSRSSSRTSSRLGVSRREWNSRPGSRTSRPNSGASYRSRF